jgi:uncharacterized membrane protein YkvA (DUF1232 family)
MTETTPVPVRGWRQRVRDSVRGFREQVRLYQAVARHPHTPRIAKWLLGLALAYALSPIDLIPDWIPVIGLLDDLILVPLVIWLAIKSVPAEVVAECRAQILTENEVSR